MRPINRGIIIDNIYQTFTRTQVWSSIDLDDDIYVTKLENGVSHIEVYDTKTKELLLSFATYASRFDRQFIKFNDEYYKFIDDKPSEIFKLVPNKIVDKIKES